MKGALGRFTLAPHLIPPFCPRGVLAALAIETYVADGVLCIAFLPSQRLRESDVGCVLTTRFKAFDTVGQAKR